MVLRQCSCQCRLAGHSSRRQVAFWSRWGGIDFLDVLREYSNATDSENIGTRHLRQRSGGRAGLGATCGRSYAHASRLRHTPGHHSLLVKLKEKGNVLITGDLVHFRENYDGNGVPWFNVSRADSLASIDRFKKLAANFKATVIIQHDARDVGLLPAFPAAAK